MPKDHPRVLCLGYLQGDKGGMGNSLYAKSHSRECALPMQKFWLRNWDMSIMSHEKILESPYFRRPAQLKSYHFKAIYIGF